MILKQYVIVQVSCHINICVPFYKIVRAAYTLRRRLSGSRHLAIDEPEAKSELSTAALSRSEARAVLRM